MNEIKERLKHELKCGYCGGKMVLVWDELEPWDSYYYHYSNDYSLGCHQRVNVFSSRLRKQYLGEPEYCDKCGKARV